MSDRIEYQYMEKIGTCYYVREMPKNKHGNRKALFKCGYCGKEFEARIGQVKSEGTKSCGCYHDLSAKERATIHEGSRNPLYYTWMNIKQRCFNENNHVYERYGGRGISVCDEWRDDYKAFHDYVTNLEWYDENNIGITKGKLTLDRYPDNDGNYEPGNVRWATDHEQAVNKRKRKNVSGYTGVCYNKRKGRYASQIAVKKKRIHLGYHDTIEQAVIARDNYIIDNNLEEYSLQVLII